MDSFGGFSGEGEWDLCSSILSLEDFDFTPIYNVIPQPDAAWFYSNLPSCHVGNDIDQFPCNIIAADHHHLHHYDQENKIMDSIFSASTTEILMQEITGFSSEDKFVNMDVQTRLGDDDDDDNNATNSANALFQHKRKSIVVADDHDHNKLINPNKKSRTSNNVQKSRKSRELSDNTKSNGIKVSPTRRRKCEEKEENGAGSCDMNSCSSDDSSEDDNASQHTNAEPPKPKTRAIRGSATDPQSLYARKRRERINERLRILQKLVPNGTKVDISTMLEEAVHYVKFLQLQIKLLSSDELWMYAPIAYNGMDIGLQQKLSSIL
ncbi:transcription factor bHLH139 [Benincasa hispida]|uniref:transcription factor bHLH139 n=1 Tax=Benincasa hispida TaxID=102211 RepID=UPI001902A6CE|nr:transcription factor bHLH139 [Benincasa hispida]